MTYRIKLSSGDATIDFVLLQSRGCPEKSFPNSRISLTRFGATAGAFSSGDKLSVERPCENTQRYEQETSHSRNGSANNARPDYRCGCCTSSDRRKSHADASVHQRQKSLRRDGELAQSDFFSLLPLTDALDLARSKDFSSTTLRNESSSGSSSTSSFSTETYFTSKS